MTTEIGLARVEYRSEKHYMGIRVQTPFDGMFAVVEQLRKELFKWFKEQGVTPQGPAFLRYHVIDMAGEMDIEFGVQVAEALPEDQRVRAGVLPAGQYAVLIYKGLGLQANKVLLNWVKDNGIALDRWDDPKGDVFTCRYEAYLTDPKIEPRKKKWDIELAFKIADQHPDAH